MTEPVLSCCSRALVLLGPLILSMISRNSSRLKKTNALSDINANKLILWRVSLPVTSDKLKPIFLVDIESKTELDPTDDIRDVIEEEPPKKTIHAIVQRPRPVLERLLEQCWQHGAGSNPTIPSSTV
ncbi:hypothetical protein EDD21DRAFT_365794 [Dissophora ornata]|nr:hypothetical protein EDD21DRAFT_365794 [Dissophora ornata]